MSLPSMPASPLKAAAAPIVPAALSLSLPQALPAAAAPTKGPVPNVGAAAPAAIAAQPQLQAAAAQTSAPKADVPAALGAAFDGSKPGHVCAACTDQPGSHETTPPAPPTPPTGRLPEAVRPQKYDLRLRLEPETASFSGRVTIAAKVSEPVDRIVLHALDLNVTQARVNGKPARVVVDPASETVTLVLDEKIAAGSARLELSYEGKMNELMRGLFKAKGKGAEGKPEAWSFTHLEPTHARRVLPSFDEPDFKAKFRLTLDVPAELTPISNMPALKERVADGRKVVTFAESPKMSSYLLAVFAARIVPLTRQVGATTVRVWAPADQIEQARFALDTAEKALLALEDYFGVPYMLPKLDLVASPDFASGAMENWGAILFRDASLLVDPKLSSQAAKRRVAEVVSHEIAHQWFGNLVTMKWWNDLWLNEAFATWVAAKVVDGYKPSWKVWDDFSQEKRAPLGIDALPGSRPVRSDAATPAEIQAMFDPITYEKGGALLRMIEDWVGEKAFRDGIRAYMKKFAYKNAEADDLWRAIEKASGKPVRRVAGAWLSQAGVPVVTAELVSPHGHTIKLSQKRFTAHGMLAPQLWPIPITVAYRLKGERKPRTERVLLEGSETTLRLTGRAEALWVYPNGGERGYYRVALGPRLLEALLAHKQQLTAVERSMLLNHLWAQVRSGDLSVGDFLDAMTRFRDDESRLVLEDMAGYLKTIRQELAADDAQRAALGAFAQKVLGSHARRLGWDAKKGERDDNALARPAVLGALALLNPSAAMDAQIDKRLASYLEDPSSVDPAVAPVVTMAAARRNDAALFEQFRARLAAPKTPEQKDLMLRTLAESTSPELLEKYLAMTLSDEIRPQDAWKPFIWLFANPLTRERAWAFAKSNWAAIVAKVGPRGATRIVGAAAGLVDDRAGVEAFFKDPKNEVEMARKTLDQALSSIDLALKFRETQAGLFADWVGGRR